ncbi:MAG: hypothetical protein ACFFBD_02540 [Candidatus Hodarchaeota archaeon]
MQIVTIEFWIGLFSIIATLAIGIVSILATILYEAYKRRQAAASEALISSIIPYYSLLLSSLGKTKLYFSMRGNLPQDHLKIDTREFYRTAVRAFIVIRDQKLRQAMLNACQGMELLCRLIENIPDDEQGNEKIIGYLDKLFPILIVVKDALDEYIETYELDVKIKAIEADFQATPMSILFEEFLLEVGKEGA